MADKITKLSDAIRLGATFRPQCWGECFNPNSSGSCVMGAAYEALGGTNLGINTTEAQSFLKQRFPEVPAEIIETLWVKNDGAIGGHGADRMTREQIADWLEAQGL